MGVSKVFASSDGSETLDVVVLGAGPAGLGAAYRASGNGRKVVVLERSDRVGGLAGSFEVAGLRVDYGSHRLHPATPAPILSELQALMGRDLQARPRHGRIYLEGRWIAFPLRAVDLLRHLPPGFGLGAARDAALAWTRKPASETFAGVLDARLGPTMCERFYFPYARKIWGLEPDEIHPEQARRRVSGNAAGKLLRKLVGRSGGAGTFYYPRRGFGQLWESLAGGCVDRGGELRLRSPARTIRQTTRGFEVVAGSGRVLRADCLWSTLPMPALARMLEPAPPGSVLSAAGGLKTRAMLLVYLVLPLDRFSPYDAHYVPDAGIAVSRISEPKNYRSGDDPVDTTVLCAEIPCSTADSIWEEDVDALTERVLDALGRMGLPVLRPNHVHIERLPSAYPVYSLDYDAPFGVLADWVDSVPGLLSFGRHGAFAHNNSHHALEMGWAAAEALGAGGPFDDQMWAEALARFESHVVQD